MTVAIAIIVVIGVALTFWNALGWHGFARDYRFEGSFPGHRYECNLRFANSEDSNPCFVGADQFGLYLLARPGEKTSWWRHRRRSLKQNYYIPWSDLEWRAGRMFLEDCIWFNIPSRRIYFYLPKEVGEHLLTDAGPLPARM